MLQLSCGSKHKMRRTFTPLAFSVFSLTIGSRMRTHIVLWLFFILFVSASFSSTTTLVVTGYCLGHQQSLLLQLKNNITTIDNAEPLVQWNQSVDCCEWKGVTCNEGLVTGLDLSQESISGGIDNSSSLFSLRSLQNLNLAYNFIRNAIPSEFGKLTNLIHLNLSNAGFGGQVPIEISQLTNLLTLDLSASELDLKLENPNLPRLIQNLTKITKLYLDGVNIAATGNEWSYAISSSMPNLQELSLSRCNLQGPIDFSLAKLQSLRIIRLSWNILSSTVPGFFAHFENLTMLDLSGCRLQGRFPERIFQVKRLEHLDLSYNIDLHGSLPDLPENGSLQTIMLKWTKFSGPLPNSISNLNYLSTLDLFRCQFNGTLPSSMSKLTKLSYLRLSSNTFTGPVPSFSMSKNLTYLDLSKNGFNNSIPSAHFQGLLSLVAIKLQNNYLNGKIPSSMFELPTVQIIQLQQNQFVGQLDDFANSSSTIQEIYLSSNLLEGPIPKSISKLVGLKILDLSYNNLSIVDDMNADSSFSSFPSLTSLSVASCKLRKFPQFLKNRNQTISYLDLSKNHLSGKIPQWIWIHGSLNLSQNYLTDWEEVPLDIDSPLYILDLHSNQLQRILPVHSLSLVHIDLSSNNLNGSIPESICNAQDLLILNLANNSLTGKLPTCLITMNGSLIVLNVRGNKLIGSIDALPGSCGLKTLDLNGNFLEGKLPRYLANCTSLEVLDLGNNLIDDNFPCWLKSVSTLRVLILRSNKLHGSIECPEPEAAWPTLQIVDLAANNFTGRIPPSFVETWKAMKVGQSNMLKLKVLQVKGLANGKVNYQDSVTLMIKGNILELVKILTIYTSIDFSANHITGPIPEELGQLKALYILNLSHNALEGNIPSSLGNLNSLESLDLSQNSLNGKIPTQLARLTFLSFLNLSFNHLVGVIPTSTQLQSFDASSFKGNDGLCGPPLTPNCSGGGGVPPKHDNSSSHKGSVVDWNFISAELGFTFGIGMVILPLVLWKRWRLWYCKHVEEMLYRIFPQLDFVYEYRGGKSYRVLRWKRH